MVDPDAILDGTWYPLESYLPFRVVTCLRRSGVCTLRDVLALAAGNELLEERNFGRRSLADLRKGVKEYLERLGVVNININRLDSTCPPGTSAAAEVEAKGEREADALKQRWEIVLLDLPVRAGNVLRELALSTVGDVLAAASDNSLLEEKNFGRKSLKDVRRALRAYLARVQSELVQLRPVVEWADLEVEDQTDDPLDRPWQEALVRLAPNVRSRVTKCFRDLGFVTVRDALGAIERGDSFPGLGQRTTEALRRPLFRYKEKAFRHSRQAAATSLQIAAEKGFTVKELVEKGIEAIPPAHRESFIDRYMHRKTLEEIGLRMGLTRERIRQKTIKAIVASRAVVGPHARQFLSPIIEALDQRKIVHVADFATLSSGADANVLALALFFAGEDDVRVWRSEFLIRTTFHEAVQNLRAVRSALTRLQRHSVPVEVARTIIENATGWIMSDQGVRRLMSAAFGIEADAADNFRLDDLMRVSARFVALLRDAERPMHLSEIARLALDGDDVAAELEAESDDALAQERLRGDSSSEEDGADAEQTRLEHRLEAILGRLPELYRVDRGTYVHRDALPVRQDLLQHAVEWCVRRIRGRESAISATTLLAEMNEAGAVPVGLSVYLLRAALARHPEIVSLRKLLVAHVASFREHGLSMADRIEDVLQCANRPLTKEEVRTALQERGTDFADPSVYCTLLASPCVLNMGNGHFVHVNRIGLSPLERRTLSEDAIRLLPEDGTPLTTRTILARLERRPRFGDLVSPGEEAAFLWAVLRMDASLECGPKGLVALATAGRSSTLLETLIANALKELTVAQPRELRAALAHSHQFSGENSLGNALVNGVARGVFRRAFNSIYALSDIDDRSLVDALASRYADEARRAVEDSPLSDVPSDQLDLIARTLYQAKQAVPARRALEVLVHRDDLSEPDGRRARRLWQVVAAL